MTFAKEIKIVYRLFLVNCYLLHVPRLPLQLASSGRGWVIDFIWLELAWQYIAMTRNNLYNILTSLALTFGMPKKVFSFKKSQICLLSQQKYNKTVQIQVTIIPKQLGRELTVPYSIQTAGPICPFYTMKMPFLLPWLQNRLQTISSQNFSMLKKNLWDEIP